MPLKRKSDFPPGGYPYVQPDTQVSFKGMVDFDSQAMNILKHRKGNSLSRATLAECQEDLEFYTCQRLGSDPKWCIGGTTNKPAITYRRTVHKCGGCGARRKK